MNKKILYILITGIALFQLTGCEDFLDKEVDLNFTEDQVFSNPRYAPAFLYNTYNTLLPGYDRYDGAMLAAGCDEAENSYSGSLIQLFNTNGISSSMNPDDVWDHFYAGIRKTNIFLEELNTTIAETNSISEEERPHFRAEALFLRALFHFELLKRYQNIPYVDEVLTIESA